MTGSQATAEAIFTSSPEGICAYDLDSRFTFWNPAMQRFTGVGTEDALGRPAAQVLPLLNDTPEGENLLAALRGEVRVSEGPCFLKPGRFFHARYAPLRDEAGTVIGGSVTIRDVTRRRTAEDLLKESEERFRALFEEAPLALHEIDREGVVRRVNQAECELLGIEAREILGRPVWEFTAPEEREISREAVRQKLNGERPLAPHSRGYSRTCGRPLVVEIHENAIRDGDGKITGIRTALIDITRRREAESSLLRYQEELEEHVRSRTAEFEKANASLSKQIAEHKRTEQQLLHSQKMEIVGRLAGGVAHDFNNLLTVISGYSRMVLEDLGPKHRRRGSLEQVVRAADRAAMLTSQLLAFSRRQAVQPRRLDLNHLVSNMDKMLRRTIGEHIQLETRLHPGLWAIKADPGQVEQMLMNLAVNAGDAMPNGGKLTIATRNSGLRPGGRSEALFGDFVALSITDTGHGMDEATRSRLFEPFFTTKGAGKGTGLGLSTVLSLVNQNGGDIKVASQPGEGATFTIFLPREEAAETENRDESAAPIGRGTETILLIEDDEDVLELARHILGQYGYRVLTALQGEEALAHCQREPGPIHLAVTDVILPLMNGRELAARMQKIQPSMKVLYMSGYTDDVIAYREDLGHAAFLNKPFCPATLARKVREVLDAQAPLSRSANS
jgi:two-component system, cell cycle sensor histidine kinase and response regulator CckA